MGACSAEGVWDGPNSAGGRRGHPGAFELREVCVECLRKPAKQHICYFYWLTRGGQAAVGELAGGGVLVHKEFPRGRGPIVSTQTFVDRAGVGGVAVQRWLRVLLLCFVGW